MKPKRAEIPDRPLAGRNYAFRMPPVAFAAGFFAAGFLAATFLAAGLRLLFCAAGFLAAGLATAFFAAGFLAATFFAAGLAAAFFAAGFFASCFFRCRFLGGYFFAAGLAAAFFTAGFLAAGLAAAFFAAGFLAATFFAAGFWRLLSSLRVSWLRVLFADVAIFILHRNFRTFTTLLDSLHTQTPCVLAKDACGIGTVSTFKKTCNKFRANSARNFKFHVDNFFCCVELRTVSRSRTRCISFPSTITSAARGRVL